jgi:hypothetical protein
MTDTTATATHQPDAHPSALRPGRALAEESSLALAETGYRLLTSGSAPLTLDGRGYPGLPNREFALPELRPRLMARSCPRSTRDAVWAELVRRSRTQGAAWTVACVGMAMPALVRLAGELCSTLADGKAEVHAEILRGFLTGLSTVELDRPSVVSRLRWHAYRAGHAAVREALDAPTPVGSGFGSAPPPPLAGHPDFVLARAVADGAISQAEADLIGTTRLEDVWLRDWASEHQLSYIAARQVRSRAERRLLAWLAEQAPGVGVLEVDPQHHAGVASAPPPPNASSVRRDLPREGVSHIGQERGVEGRRRTPHTTTGRTRHSKHRMEEPRCA